MSRRVVRSALLAMLAASVLAVACGKKGPPLPPLVLLPNPPADFTAVRRGAQVDLAFRIPEANTDRSTPADLERVDIFGWTTPGPVSADEVIQRGVRVGSIAVNLPKDPDEPEPETPAQKGPGLDQNAVATFTDALAPADPSAYRTYVVVGVNSRGRYGALSPRVSVPLVEPPPAPPQPQVAYDEQTIAVSWTPVTSSADPAVAYAVYRAGTPAAALTPTPISEVSFADSPVAWDEERCYEVRAVVIVESVRMESAASPSRCVTPHDTFAPAAPTGLVGVGSEGAISLIWTASREADLAGYLVLQAVAPATELSPLTPEPIPDTTFRAAVPAGSRVTYAVQAVDKSGNRSAPSATITETAR